MKQNRIWILILLVLTLFLPLSELLSRMLGLTLVIHAPLPTALISTAVFVLLYVLLLSGRDNGIGSVMRFICPLLPLFSVANAVVWIFKTDDTAAALMMLLWMPISFVCTLLLRCSIPLKVISSVLSFLLVLPLPLALTLGDSTETVVRSRSVSPSGAYSVEVVEYTSVDVEGRPVVLGTHMRVYQQRFSPRLLSLEWRYREQTVALEEGEEVYSVIWLNDTTFVLSDQQNMIHDKTPAVLHSGHCL